MSSPSPRFTIRKQARGLWIVRKTNTQRQYGCGPTCTYEGHVEFMSKDFDAVLGWLEEFEQFANR